MKQKTVKTAGLFLSLLIAGCNGATTPVSDKQIAGNAPGANQQPAATVQTNAAPQTPLEKELDYVGKGGFRQVLVFSRKNGAALTSEDVDYFKQHAPSEQINQRLKTSDNKHLVAGTNFAFRPEQLDALRKRFAVADETEKYGRRQDGNSNAKPSPTKEN